MAILCNMLWGSALPFIKMGYRLFAIDSCRYSVHSLLCGRPLHDGRGAGLAGRAGAEPPPAAHAPRQTRWPSACGLGLWQTAAQYFFYYSAVALLTGAMGGIINSTQSFMGVIRGPLPVRQCRPHDPAQGIGLRAGFWRCACLPRLGNHGSGSAKGMSVHAAGFGHLLRWPGRGTRPSRQQDRQLHRSVSSTWACGGLALAVMGFAMGGSLHPQQGCGYPGIARCWRSFPVLAMCCGLC